jgi:hypothetical protein
LPVGQAHRFEEIMSGLGLALFDAFGIAIVIRTVRWQRTSWPGWSARLTVVLVRCCILLPLAVPALHVLNLWPDPPTHNLMYAAVDRAVRWAWSVLRHSS